MCLILSKATNLLRTKLITETLNIWNKKQEIILQKVKRQDNENSMKEKAKEGCGCRKTGSREENQRQGMDTSIGMEPAFNKDGGAISVGR